MHHPNHQNGGFESFTPLQPQYEFLARPVGQLACGQLVMEPALGLARVAAVDQEEAPPHYLHITWSDDHGSSRATGRYHADRVLPVRLPGLADRLAIRQGIDQATWLGRDIKTNLARLIAAHLHLGPCSALFTFALDGAITDDLYDELQVINTNQPVYQSWVHALARYCLSREDQGSLPAWEAKHPDDSRSRPSTNGKRRSRRSSTSPTTNASIPSKLIRTETAQELIEAAFALGLAAAGSNVVARTMRQRLEHPGRRVDRRY